MESNCKWCYYKEHEDDGHGLIFPACTNKFVNNELIIVTDNPKDCKHYKNKREFEKQIKDYSQKLQHLNGEA